MLPQLVGLSGAVAVVVVIVSSGVGVVGFLHALGDAAMPSQAPGQVGAAVDGSNCRLRCLMYEGCWPAVLRPSLPGKIGTAVDEKDIAGLTLEAEMLGCRPATLLQSPGPRTSNRSILLTLGAGALGSCPAPQLPVQGCSGSRIGAL